MPANPVPTTTLLDPPGHMIVPPHGETHELEGIDPVLPNIMFLGQTGTISHDGTDIDETMTDSSLTLSTYGGVIQVVVTASREMDTVAAADTNAINLQSGYTLYIDGAQAASYGRSSAIDTYNMTFTTNTLDEPLSTQFTTDGTWTWYLRGVEAGEHIFHLKMFVNTNTHAYFSGLITYFELLPTRRV